MGGVFIGSGIGIRGVIIIRQRRGGWIQRGGQKSVVGGNAEVEGGDVGGVGLLDVGKGGVVACVGIVGGVVVGVRVVGWVGVAGVVVAGVVVAWVVIAWVVIAWVIVAWVVAVVVADV